MSARILAGILIVAGSFSILTLTGCPKQTSSGESESGVSGFKTDGSAEAIPVPDPTEIKMAFVPSTEAEKIVENTAELDKLISDKLGIPVKSVVLPHYVAAVESLGTGDCLVAWIPPLAYIYANDRHGARVVLKAVRKGTPFYKGQIIVRADSDIKTVADLKSRTIAFVDPNSTSGNLYPRALLMAAGIDPDTDLGTSIFSGAHDTVVIAVLQGSVDAGACYVDARTRVVDLYPKVMEETRVIAETEPIPGDAVVLAGPEFLSDEWIKRITDAIIDVMHSEEGKKIIYDIYEIEDLLPTSDADYAPVRKMAESLGLDVEKQLKGG
jgi:phosphonate transport system substrate-binding protein